MPAAPAWSTGTVTAPMQTSRLDIFGVGPVSAQMNVTLGTVTANGATNVNVGAAMVTASSMIVFTLKTVGGTVGAYPSVKTITPGTGFAVACTAGDTSIYNYVIIG